jgi:hypothetical protein
MGNGPDDFGSIDAKWEDLRTLPKVFGLAFGCGVAMSLVTVPVLLVQPDTVPWNLLFWFPFVTGVAVTVVAACAFTVGAAVASIRRK